MFAHGLIESKLSCFIQYTRLYILPVQSDIGHPLFKMDSRINAFLICIKILVTRVQFFPRWTLPKKFNLTAVLS